MAKPLKLLSVGDVLYIGASTSSQTLLRPMLFEGTLDSDNWTRCEIVKADAASYTVETRLSFEDVANGYTKGTFNVSVGTFGTLEDLPIVDWFYTEEEKALFKKRESIIAADATLLKMPFSEIAAFLFTETKAELSQA